MQDHVPRLVLDRRSLLAGAAVLSVAAAASGCGGDESSSTPARATLGATGDVPVGGGKVYEQQRVVVTQPVQGTFHAFSAICTHQGCTVIVVDGATIKCPCHGSRFDTSDGSVLRGPAQEPLTRLAVAVEAGTLTLPEG